VNGNFGTATVILPFTVDVVFLCSLDFLVVLRPSTCSSLCMSSAAQAGDSVLKGEC